MDTVFKTSVISYVIKWATTRIHDETSLNEARFVFLEGPDDWMAGCLQE